NHSDPSRATHASIAEQLERRLFEAWQGLWDSFVDPRESFYDDGCDWVALGAGLNGSSAAHGPLFNEPQLREIRESCRALAVPNEFAINGLETRISYLVGSGHTYRVTARRGSDDLADSVEAAQAVVDEFIETNCWHRRQQEIVRRIDRDGE